MNMLILDDAAQDMLEHLNASGDPTLQLVPLPLHSGEAALTAALLADCGEEETWAHYETFLENLPEMDVTSDMIDEPSIN